jgi:hypothetical protein
VIAAVCGCCDTAYTRDQFDRLAPAAGGAQPTNYAGLVLVVRVCPCKSSIAIDVTGEREVRA